MEFRSNAKGIQQEDVWMAADALISEGLRPTIERVRQKIGRGSPNTVSPMLEAWFATLASRLGVNSPKSDDTHIPKVLQQAVEDLWQMAMSQSQQEASLQVAKAKEEVAQANRTLEIRANELDQQEQVRLVKQQTLEEALNSALGKSKDLADRLDRAKALTKKQETDLENLRNKLSSTEDERNLGRLRLAEEAMQHAQERLKSDERHQASQHKLLEEIDKARQETKKATGSLQLAEKRFDSERSLAQQENRALLERVAQLQELLATQSTDLRASHEALLTANLRADEVQNLLARQRIASENTIAGLTKALTMQTSRQAIDKKSAARKVKRPIRRQRFDK